MPLSNAQIEMLWNRLTGEVVRLSDDMTTAARDRDFGKVYDAAVQILDLMDTYRSSEADREDEMRRSRQDERQMPTTGEG